VEKYDNVNVYFSSTRKAAVYGIENKMKYKAGQEPWIFDFNGSIKTGT
jgi:hypothetical protein